MLLKGTKGAIRRSRTTARLSGLVLFAVLFMLVSACGSPPKRPAYTGADSVAAVPANALVGTWRYQVLNPIDENENKTETVYTFKADGTWIANADTTRSSPEFPFVMEATGSWSPSGERYTVKTENVRETSGSQLAGVMVSFMQGLWNKQTGEMNPYSISADQIVMVSEEYDQAIQLTRIR